MWYMEVYISLISKQQCIMYAAPLKPVIEHMYILQQMLDLQLILELHTRVAFLPPMHKASDSTADTTLYCIIRMYTCYANVGVLDHLRILLRKPLIIASHSQSNHATSNTYLCIDATPNMHTQGPDLIRFINTVSTESACDTNSQTHVCKVCKYFCSSFPLLESMVVGMGAN